MLYVIQNKNKEYYSDNYGWNKDIEKARTFRLRSHVKLFVTHNAFKIDNVKTITVNVIIAKHQEEDIIKEIKNKQLLTEIERGN